MNKELLTKVFSFWIIILSVLSITIDFQRNYFFSMFISLIGIIGGILLLLKSKQKIRNYLILIWIFSQLIILKGYDYDLENENLGYTIIDASQYININIPINYAVHKDFMKQININILSIIYFLIYKYLIKNV